MDAITKFKKELINAVLIRVAIIVVCGIAIVIEIGVIRIALIEKPLSKGHIQHDQDPRITQHIDK